MMHIQKVMCSYKKAKVPMFTLVKKGISKLDNRSCMGFLAAVRSECKNDGFLRV